MKTILPLLGIVLLTATLSSARANDLDPNSEQARRQKKIDEGYYQNPDGTWTKTPPKSNIDPNSDQARRQKKIDEGYRQNPDGTWTKLLNTRNNPLADQKKKSAPKASASPSP